MCDSIRIPSGLPGTLSPTAWLSPRTARAAAPAIHSRRVIIRHLVEPKYGTISPHAALCLEEAAMGYIGRAKLQGFPMNRRQFITSTGAASLIAAQDLAAVAAPRASVEKPVLMKVGDQT